MSEKVKQKVSMVSLGCPKNLVDAEVMLGVLSKQDYEITMDEKDADVIILIRERTHRPLSIGSRPARYPLAID